jgi:putative heme iron utilization protein
MASAQFDSGFGWLHCLRMAKTVEIPDELHEALAARARAEGVSVPDMVARELGMMIPKRPLDEIIDEVLAQPRIHVGSSTADIIRELRGPLPGDDDGRH